MAAQSAVAIPLTALLIQPFRFMDLPTEIRLKVYSYALSDLGLVIGKTECDNLRVDYRPKIRNISLLRTSKKVFTEAMPIFYELNRFHYTILRMGPSFYDNLDHFRMHLHLMQHVSINYTVYTPRWTISEADEHVCTHVRSITNGCPRLRTFTLCLSNPFMHEDGFSASSQTALEMSRLAARLQDKTYRLEWIAIGCEWTKWMHLRDKIAPRKDWLSYVTMEWPGVSIDQSQEEGFEKLEDGAKSRRIGWFYLWPAMRRRLQDREKRVGETA